MAHQDPKSGEPLNISTGEITRQEILNVLNSLKSGEATEPDNIPTEALKQGEEEVVNRLHRLLNLVWNTGQIPIDWKRGLL
jgi:hypothetical protein